MPTAPTIEMRWDRQRLLVVAGGAADPKWMLGLIDQVGHAAETHPTRSVLVDVRAIRITYTDLDRYTLGVQVGRRWRNIPYAMVSAPDVVDPRRFGELVAQNRGVIGRLFIDLNEAVEWLDAQHRMESA